MTTKTDIRIRQAQLAPETQQRATVSVNRVPNPLENFNSEYKKWPNFKSQFFQFFHDNESLDTGSKFFRLDEHIEKDTEPYNLIIGYDRIPANYGLAWEQLCATYDNKRKLVDELISSFIDLPPMPSATRGNLMIIINAVNQMTKSLVRYEEMKVESWNPIVVNLLMRKLDTETVTRWKHERPQREVPKLANILQFLENSAESMDGDCTKPVVAASQVQPNQH